MRMKQILPTVVAAIIVNGQDPRWTGTRFITIHRDQYLERCFTEGTWVRSKVVQQTRWEGHFSKMAQPVSEHGREIAWHLEGVQMVH